MIFLTVGTTKFPFSRLIKAVDEALVNLKLGEKLIAQVGDNKYQFSYQNKEIFSEVPFPKMIFYLSRARVVIAHGGVATILLALKYAKNKPLVVPRSKKFNEHIDSHQIFFSKFLAEKKLIKVAFPDENLFAVIGDYLRHPQKLSPKKRASSRKKLIKKLIGYTESI